MSASNPFAQSGDASKTHKAPTNPFAGGGGLAGKPPPKPSFLMKPGTTTTAGTAPGQTSPPVPPVPSIHVTAPVAPIVPAIPHIPVMPATSDVEVPAVLKTPPPIPTTITPPPVPIVPPVPPIPVASPAADNDVTIAKIPPTIQIQSTSIFSQEQHQQQSTPPAFVSSTPPPVPPVPPLSPFSKPTTATTIANTVLPPSLTVPSNVNSNSTLTSHVTVEVATPVFAPPPPPVPVVPAPVATATFASANVPIDPFFASAGTTSTSNFDAFESNASHGHVDNAFDMSAFDSVTQSTSTAQAHDDFGLASNVKNANNPIDSTFSTSQTTFVPSVPPAVPAFAPPTTPSTIPPTIAAAPFAASTASNAPDDDPFDMHLNRPVQLNPTTTSSTTTAKKPARPNFHESIPSKESNNSATTKTDDPFSTLVQLKPSKPNVQPATEQQPTTQISQADRGVPLNQLLSSTSRVSSVPFAIPTINNDIVNLNAVNEDDDPYEIHLKPAVAPPAIPTVPTTSTTSVVNASHDFEQQSSHHSDGFAATHADFDVFGTSTNNTINNNKTVSLTANDLDFLETQNNKSSNNKIPQQHPVDPFATPSLTAAPALDIFGAPPSVVAKPETSLHAFGHNNIVDPFANHTATSTSHQIVNDPFAIGFDDADPFASHQQPLKQQQPPPPQQQPQQTPSYSSTNLLEDDGFGVFDRQSLHGEQDDPMKKLRQVYHLQDPSVNELEVDDDVDNYDSKYLQAKARTAPNQPPLQSQSQSQSQQSVKSTGSSSPNPTSTDMFDGDILTRMSTKSLLTKDWHDSYYIIKGSTLYIFKSKWDFQKDKTSFKKKIPITHNLRVLQIKAKEYKGLGTVYNFMLEEVLDYGPSNIGKFGSTYRDAVEDLWKRIRQIILRKREERAQANQRYG